MDAEEFIIEEYNEKKSMSSMLDNFEEYNYHERLSIGSNTLDLVGSAHYSPLCVKYLKKMFDENDYDGVFMEQCLLRLSVALTNIRDKPYVVRREMDEEVLSNVYLRNKELFYDESLPKYVRKLTSALVNEETGFLYKPREGFSHRNITADMDYCLIRGLEEGCDVYAVDDNLYYFLDTTIIGELFARFCPYTLFKKLASFPKSKRNSFEPKTLTSLDVTGDYLIKSDDKIVCEKTVGEDEELELLDVYVGDDGFIYVVDKETGDEIKCPTQKLEKQTNNIEYLLVRSILFDTEPEELSGGDISIEKIIEDSSLEKRANSEGVSTSDLIEQLEKLEDIEMGILEEGATEERENNMIERTMKVLSEEEDKNYLMVVGAAHYNSILEKLKTKSKE